MIDEKDDAEGCDDVVEVISAVEMSKHHEFEQEPAQQGGAKRQDERCEEASGDRVESNREIGAEHVLDAVGKVDEVHHAEHQREACRDQEQKDAELQPVEGLNHEEGGGHLLSDPRAGRDPGPRPSAVRTG